MIDLLTYILKGIVSGFIYFWPVLAIVFIFFAWQNKRKTKWVENQESVVLKIKIPKTNDKDPTAAEMMFATLHGILKPKKEHIKEGTIQDHISFEIVADEKAINFYVWTPKHIKDFVEGQIYAQYPTAEISECDDYAANLSKDEFTDKRVFSGAEISLSKADYLPIKTFTNFTVDPLAGITGVLSKLEGKKEEIWVQILARPVDDTWKKPGLSWIKSKKEGKATSSITLQSIFEQPIKLIADFIKIAIIGPLEPGNGGGNDVKLSAEEESMISGVQEKSEKLAYETKIRILYTAEGSEEKSKERIQAIIGAFKQFNTTNLNAFHGKGIKNIKHFLTEYKNRLFIADGYHLNIEEIASIYHLPHTSVETPNITWTTFRTGEPPTSLPTLSNCEPNDIALFAETNFRSKSAIFGLKRDDRRRHMYIIGKSGMGKTKLLENLVINDIINGEGVAIIDPHGDFYTDILNKIPKERMKDVVLFDPSDVNNPIAFNPMEVVDESLKVQIAAGIVGTFKKIFGYSWGPRLEYVLQYTILALLDTPNTTLMGIVRMLTDKKYRKTIVDNIKDPVVKKFWVSEFATYNDKQASETIAPILNKVGQFIANSLVRNVIGQPKSSFNIREMMDSQKIFLVNLSVGKVGETNASLLGSFMITSIHLAAMSRADIDEDKRKDFYLYVDEFQNFATDSFKNILSEARKYKLALTLANQYTAQLEDTGVKEAVFGNVGTLITFRVGAADAAELEKEFNPPFEAQDLINLPKQHIYTKMTIDGQSETAFSAKTLTVTSEKTGFIDEIIENSRKKYTKSKEEVEKEVADWSGMDINYANVDKEIEEKENNNKKSTPSDNLSKIIKENTTHIVNNRQQTTDNNIIDNNEVIKKEIIVNENNINPKSQQIKDMIDKETLSAIIGHIVKPSSKDNEATFIDNDKKVVGKSEEIKNHNPKQKADDNKEEAKVVTSSQNFPTHSKKEIFITPKNFKDIKHIHPHEIAMISEKEPQEIEEGEEIIFGK